MSQQGKGKLNVCWTSRPLTSLGHHTRGVKSFLRGGQIFKLCPIVSKYVQHIFPVGAKMFPREASPPLVTGLWPVDFHTSQENKNLLSYFIRILNSCVVSWIRSCKPGCAPASPAAYRQCSTARIGQGLSAAWFCSWQLLWRSDECVTPLF